MNLIDRNLFYSIKTITYNNFPEISDVEENTVACGDI